MIKSIMGFQTESDGAFWSEPLYYFYPQLDKAYSKRLSFPERKAYIENTLKSVYIELEGEINQKVELYSRYFSECKDQITDALSDAFDIDCSKLFNDLRCNVSLNPIEPRFLKERSFDVFYKNSEKGAVGESIHEIIHFVWFYVWNSLFKDDFNEYERPSLKWILSEMVVETIMKDERLSSINPYFPRENGGCIYPYFFDMKVEERLVLDTLDAMYHGNSMKDFMRLSFAYCRKHENEIRAHIELAESKGIG